MLTIDGLNEKRFAMPLYRFPVLYRYTKRSWCQRGRDDDDEDEPELGDPELDLSELNVPEVELSELEKPELGEQALVSPVDGRTTTITQ